MSTSCVEAEGWCGAWHPWLQNGRHSWSAPRYPTLHAGFWLLAAVDPLGATVELAGGPSRRLTIPVVIGRDFFCRRFTFSQVPHSIPTHQTRPFRTQTNIPLVTPPAILIPPSDRLSSQLQPGISSLQPNPTSSHPKHRSTPCVKLCTLTLLRHPHLWCSTSRPPL